MMDKMVFEHTPGGRQLYYRVGDLVMENSTGRPVALIDGNKVYAGVTNDATPIAELDGNIVKQPFSGEYLGKIENDTYIDWAGVDLVLYSRDHMLLVAAGALTWNDRSLRWGKEPSTGDNRRVSQTYSDMLGYKIQYFSSYSGDSDDESMDVVESECRYESFSDETGLYGDSDCICDHDRSNIFVLYDDSDSYSPPSFKGSDKFFDGSCTEASIPAAVFSIAPFLFCLTDSVVVRAMIAIFGVPVMLICIFNFYMATCVDYFSNGTVYREPRAKRVLIVLSIAVMSLLFATYAMSSGVLLCSVIHAAVAAWAVKRVFVEFSSPDMETV